MSDYDPKPISDLALPPCRVLVAEGSVTLRLLIRGLLRQWGCVAEAVPAGTHPEAGLAGFDLLVARRSMASGGAPLPVATGWLTVTAPTGPLASAGPEQWVMLPLQPRDLHAVVALCLRPDDRGSGIDADCIGMLWGDSSNPVYRRVASMFLTEMPRRLHALQAALAEGDEQSLQREAHTIGSAAANVGCMSIARLARYLEAAVEARLSNDYGVLAATTITVCDRDLPLLASVARTSV